MFLLFFFLCLAWTLVCTAVGKLFFGFEFRIHIDKKLIIIFFQVDRAGRKILLLIGIIGMCVSSFLLVAFRVLGVFFLIFLHSLSIGLRNFTIF